MAKTDELRLESRRHFKMLASLMVAIGIFQTAWLDYRSVSPEDLRSVRDTVISINAFSVKYEAAKTRSVIRQEIINLDDAIFQNVLIPIEDIRKQLKTMDSTWKRNEAENQILIDYQAKRIQQILHRKDTVRKYYLEDPIRF